MRTAFRKPALPNLELESLRVAAVAAALGERGAREHAKHEALWPSSGQSRTSYDLQGWPGPASTAPVGEDHQVPCLGEDTNVYVRDTHPA